MEIALDVMYNMREDCKDEVYLPQQETKTKEEPWETCRDLREGFPTMAASARNTSEKRNTRVYDGWTNLGEVYDR